MLDYNNILSIYSSIKNLNVGSQEMNNYINSLTKEEYAQIATVYIIGRNGWEKNYYETNEYFTFIEEQEVNGIKVTEQMLDEKFLSKKEKVKQVSLTYDLEFKDAIKIDKSYNHNWLSSKTNLISAIENGLLMLKEIS